MTTKTKRLAPGQFELLNKETGVSFGRYGGREGMKWAQTPDGEMITEDSPVSVCVLKGLLIAAAKRENSTAKNER